MIHLTEHNPYAKLNVKKKPAADAVNVIGMAPQFELIALRQKVRELEAQVTSEHAARLEAELTLRDVLEDRERNWKRILSPEEREQIRLQKDAAWQERQVTGTTSDGRPLPKAADSFHSYTDMSQFLETLKATGRMGVRNWAMMRCGICLGLRVSDLLRLKWSWLKNPDGTWKDRIPVIEKKTSKLNRILITDGVKETLDEYIDWLGGYDPNAYVFGKSNGKQMNTKVASRILTKMNETVGLSMHISSHTMRKTFANIIVSCYDGTMQMEAIDKAQRALNHSTQEMTGRYLATIDEEVDNARRAVSDFVLGKSDVDVLGVPKMKTNNELFDAIESIRKLVGEQKEESDTDAETI